MSRYRFEFRLIYVLPTSPLTLTTATHPALMTAQSQPTPNADPLVHDSSKTDRNRVENKLIRLATDTLGVYCSVAGEATPTRAFVKKISRGRARSPLPTSSSASSACHQRNCHQRNCHQSDCTQRLWTACAGETQALRRTVASTSRSRADSAGRMFGVRWTVRLRDHRSAVL